MRFLIRRIISTVESTGNFEYSNTEINTNKLTIGRATDQHVQLTDPQVKFEQAEIFRRVKGSFHIRSLDIGGIIINNRLCKQSQIKPGDQIGIGQSTLFVEPTPPGYDFCLSFRVGENKEIESYQNRFIVTLRQAGLSLSFWCWCLGLATLILAFVLPLITTFHHPSRELLVQTELSGDRVWDTGRLHKAHRMVIDDCQVCHAEPFVRVQNRECDSCHADTQHHFRLTDVEPHILKQTLCQNCHKEHNKHEQLIQRDPALCIDCHKDLKLQNSKSRLRNVSNFTDDHPEFRVTLLIADGLGINTLWRKQRFDFPANPPPIEQSNLKFSHKEHLASKGIKSPQGNVKLTCRDCHQPENSGRLMQPIRMTQHCIQCHTLQFDPATPDRTLPHGNPIQVTQTLREYYSRVYLDRAIEKPVKRILRRPGQSSRILSRETQKRALVWADQQALKVANELFKKRGCVDCHKITIQSQKKEFDRWQVEPIRITRQWLPLAQFDHSSHRTQDCRDCHKAEDSDHAKDILMPALADCKECHSQPKLASDCIDCHKFHLPDTGLLFVDRAGSLVQQKSNK